MAELSTCTAVAVILSLYLVMLTKEIGVTAILQKVKKNCQFKADNFNTSEFLGQICPQSHPIPCLGGKMCTSKARAVHEQHCDASDIVNGVCCPEDVVPCKLNKLLYRCKENPQYGRN